MGVKKSTSASVLKNFPQNHKNKINYNVNKILEKHFGKPAKKKNKKKWKMRRIKSKKKVKRKKSVSVEKSFDTDKKSISFDK